MPSHSARQAAAEARAVLRSGLKLLQERAIAEGDERRRAALLKVAERGANILGVLFGVERADYPEAGQAAIVYGVLADLRRLLHDLQKLLVTDPRLDPAAEGVASALAALFMYRDHRRQIEAQEQGIPLRQVSRRASERVQLDVEVGFATESNFYAGLSMDISLGGLFVATYKLHPVGTAVALTFELPDGRRIASQGEVRWVRESAGNEHSPGMGIAFAQISPEDLSAIVAFCRQRNPMYFDDDD